MKLPLLILPDLIRTSQLILRAWRPEDAPMMVRAIGENLEHLRPWMPWAHEEPQPVDRKLRMIQQWQARVNRGEDLMFAIRHAQDEAFVGAIGMHGRIGVGAMEIGYWIHVEHIGKGYATQASAALVRLGFEHMELRRIEIHCDPLNVASAAVPRKLGFTHSVTIPQCVKDESIQPRDTMIWSLRRAEYDRSAASLTTMEMVDVLGRRLEFGQRDSVDGSPTPGREADPVATAHDPTSTG